MAPAPLPSPLAALHRELGIPADYATARSLTPQPEIPEAELVDVGLNPDGRPVRLAVPAAQAWQAMRCAASADGVELIAVSGFRPLSRQTQIIREKLAAGQPIESILQLIAAPGFSEHHSGRALDLGTPGHIDLEEEFAATPAFRWLEQNAARFGFRLSYPRDNPWGIAYEPWHWLLA